MGEVHILFATPLGLAASLRPDGFVSGAVCFVRRTLARSVFLGFHIGIPRCKRNDAFNSDRSREELYNEQDPDSNE